MAKYKIFNWNNFSLLANISIRRQTVAESSFRIIIIIMIMMMIIMIIIMIITINISIPRQTVAESSFRLSKLLTFAQRQKAACREK